MPEAPGTKIAERCARHLETPCGACRSESCPRCQHASEIRAAAVEIQSAREREIDEAAISAIVQAVDGSLCPTHAEFGKHLVEIHRQRTSGPTT